MSFSLIVCLVIRLIRLVECDPRYRKHRHLSIVSARSRSVFRNASLCFSRVAGLNRNQPLYCRIITFHCRGTIVSRITTIDLCSSRRVFFQYGTHIDRSSTRRTIVFFFQSHQLFSDPSNPEAASAC